MRYSIVLAPAAMALVASAQDSYTNPFTSYLTQTNALGVVTGQPLPDLNVNTNVVTSQPSVVTSQPSVNTDVNTNVVTSQPSVVTAIPSIIATGGVPIGTGAAGTGASQATNGTFTRPTTLRTSKTSTGTASESTTETSTESATSTESSTASASPTTDAAACLKPVLGLGLAGALFAAFL